MSTKFKFAVSLNLDLAYATLADSSLKDIVMPDALIDGNDVLKKLVIS